MSSSRARFCDLVAGVVMESAAETCDRFLGLVRAEPLRADRTRVLTTFTFMNFTFAQGAWSNISDTALRRDLLSRLRDEVTSRLAQTVTGSSAPPVVAARAAGLAEELSAYMRHYVSRMQEIRGADSRAATLFGLEQVQESCCLSDELMGRVVPTLIPAEGLGARVEAVALQVNEAATPVNRGFWARLFGSPFDETLENCDLQFAREELRHRFSGGLYPAEMTKFLDAFDRQPTRQNAEALLRYEPAFVAAFKDNVATKAFMGDHRPWTGDGRLNARTLKSEPEFEDLVTALIEDTNRYHELQEILKKRGYSEGIISQAIGEHFRDLA